MKRRHGREIAVQCLYVMEMNQVGLEDALDSVSEGEFDEAAHASAADSATRSYARRLCEGVSDRLSEIDGILGRYLTGWRMERLSRVDKQIMRLAAYEMLYDPDMPPKVAVNEAIEIAKHFGTDDSGKFVNGVLGKMLKDLDEIKAAHARETAENTAEDKPSEAQTSNERTSK